MLLSPPPRYDIASLCNWEKVALLCPHSCKNEEQLRRLAEDSTAQTADDDLLTSAFGADVFEGWHEQAISDRLANHRALKVHTD